MEKTVCELFAGVGGFRVGLEDSSKKWKTVWMNQWEPGKKNQYAFDCYTKHYGASKNYVNRDICTINKEDIPNHNLLVGGFPCQDYSVAHSGAEGIEGKKGVLWWQIRDIIIAKQPKFVLLENVDRLLKSPTNQRGRDFGIILQSFKELGYGVEWRVINAAEYGFAQRRKRIFIFAFKNNTKYYNRCVYDCMYDIIHTTGFFYRQFPIGIGEFGNISEFRYENLLDVSNRFKYNFKNSGVMIRDDIYTENVECTNPTYIKLGDLLQDDVESKYYIKDNLKKWEYAKGSKDIIRKAGTDKEYHYREGAMAFPDRLDKPARTMLTSEGSLNRCSHILLDSTNRYRILTPIETERINGFPDNWTNTGMTERFRYFCMGNALVVGIITKIGYTLNEIFKIE